MKKRIGIIADSSSGLSIKDLNDMEIEFCPLLITFSDNTTVNDHPKILKKEEFYNRIINEKQLAKTSQTPIGHMKIIWEHALTKFEKVIFIPLSKGLSGQYNTAIILSKEYNFKNKVFVFDSNGVSIINWLLVKKAYEMSLNKKNKIDDIIKALNLIKNNYIAFILPYNLKYLVKGGRISKSAAALATMLKITPILYFNGKIDKFDKTRTWEKAIKNTLKEIDKRKKIENITLFYIIHAFANEKKIKKVKQYVEDYKIKNIKIIELANIICIHTGIETFCFVAFDLKKNQLPKL